MRQAVRAFVIGGVLLAATACGSVTNPPPGAPGVGIGSATAPAAAVDSSVKSSCEALGQVYNKHMAPLAQALTQLVDKHQAGGADKDARQQVRQALEAFATAILDATRSSTDPQVRADGAQAAGQLRAKAADAATFSKIKTTEDVNTALGPTLKQWLAPIEKHCS